MILLNRYTTFPARLGFVQHLLLEILEILWRSFTRILFSFNRIVTVTMATTHQFPWEAFIFYAVGLLLRISILPAPSYHFMLPVDTFMFPFPLASVLYLVRISLLYTTGQISTYHAAASHACFSLYMMMNLSSCTQLSAGQSVIIIKKSPICYIVLIHHISIPPLFLFIFITRYSTFCYRLINSFHYWEIHQ